MWDAIGSNIGNMKLGIEFLSYTISWDLISYQFKTFSVDMKRTGQLRVAFSLWWDSDVSAGWNHWVSSNVESQSRVMVNNFLCGLKAHQWEIGGIVILLWLSCLLSILIRHNEFLKLRISIFLGFRCVKATGVFNW